MDGNIPPARITVQLVSDDSEWDNLQKEWNQLFEAVLAARAPLHFDWMRTWWTIYGPHYARSHGLNILTFRREQRLAGLLPLYMGQAHPAAMGVRCLRFLSTGETRDEETCPDYLDLLCREEDAYDCTVAAIQAIDQIPKDQLALQAMPQQSPLAIALGHDRRIVRSPGDFCPVADLSGGFENYLQRLSSNGRQQARRLIRDIEKHHSIFELADVSNADSFVQDLIDLHQARWVAEGKPGCFAASRFTEFHRKLIQLWLPSNRVALARLRMGDRPIAVLYGFCHHNRFEFYQSGVGDAPELRSPGIACHLLLMRELASRNVHTYDFLRGSSVYKDRLATASNELTDLMAWQSTFRAIAYRTTRSAMRSIVRRFRRPANPQAGSSI